MFSKIFKILICFLVSIVVLTQCGCAVLNFHQEYDKGIRLYNEKKYDEAIVSFNNALEYKPDSYSAICYLGTSYAYNKDLKMAEKTYQEAIRLFPDSWNAYVLLADVKRKQKDYQTAIDFYETAVTLESMGGKEKLYYKNLLKEVKEEQTSYALKDPIAQREAKERFKNEILNAHAKEKTLTEKQQTGEVVLALDSKLWEKQSEQKDAKSQVIQYGLKGEDVKNYKWTQLVTVQYFVQTDNFKTTLEEYYKTHTGAIETVAKNSGKTFVKKIINQSNSEIFYEWNFDNGKETELARIVYTPQGIYHLHVAKKGLLNSEEKARYAELLKTALLR